jgi:hypothetical protein
MEQKKNKIILSKIYNSKFNDDKKNVREVYIRDKILQEYLFLKNIENDKEQIGQNKLMSLIVNDQFYEKMSINYSSKYEGVLIVEFDELFFEQKNIFWKFYDGYCFVLVCSIEENNLMASNLLNIIQIFSKPELLESPENFSIVLDLLLPNGQLMYLTKKAAQELVKLHVNL